MKNLKEVLAEANGLYGKIDSILRSSTYDRYDDLGGLDIDYRDGGQLFLLGELQAVMGRLDEVKGRLEYLARPIREVSRLHRNESGRYETDGGHFYTSGSSIEALAGGGFREVPYWVSKENAYLLIIFFKHNADDILLDGKLRETQTANYFSEMCRIDCAVPSVNAQSCRKCGTLLSPGIPA